MSNEIKQETPLWHFLSSFNKGLSNGGLLNAETECGVVVKEAPLSAHLILRGDSRDAVFCSAVSDTLGVELPLRYVPTINRTISVFIGSAPMNG